MLRLECILKNTLDFERLICNNDFIIEIPKADLYFNHIDPTLNMLNRNDGDTKRLNYHLLQITLGGIIAQAKERFEVIGTGHIYQLTIDYSHVDHEMAHNIGELDMKAIAYHLQVTFEVVRYFFTHIV